MSDPENLLARWSRRKRDARASEGDVSADGSEGAALDSAATPPGETPLPFDLASLPTLDSIDAETDLRAFLRHDVPAELARAALRRGWSTDPAIRDFIGLSENSWDFNAPGGIPGFGSLAPADIQRLLTQAFEEAGVTEKAVPTSAAPASSDQNMAQIVESATGLEMPQAVSAGELSSSVDQHAQARRVSADGPNTGLAESNDHDRGRSSRRHGGALPHSISTDSSGDDFQ